MNIKFASILAFGAMLFGQTLAQAATLEVTHSPASGQYGSVKAAIDAAQSGDVIEIIDSSAVYNDVILYQKGADFTLTIRGKSTLATRPTLKPTGSTYVTSPFDGGLKPLLSSDGTITVENLILDGSDKSCNLPIDFRSGDVKKVTLNNVDLINPNDSEIFTVLVEKPLEINNCNFTMDRPFYLNIGATATVKNSTLTFTNFSTWVHGTTNTFENVTINGGCDLSGGSLTAKNCSFQNGITVTGNDGDATLNVSDSTVYAGGGSMFQVNSPATREGDPRNINVTFLNTMLRASTVLHTNAMYIAQGFDKMSLTFDNCDIAGNPDTNGGENPTDSGFLIVNTSGVAGATPATIRVVDTIFSNLAFAAYAWISGADADAADFSDDYNAFYLTAFANRDVTQGAHDITLDDTPYVDMLNGDNQLVSTSPAATLNSTGVPAYAGSQGVFGAVNAARSWEVFE